MAAGLLAAAAGAAAIYGVVQRAGVREERIEQALVEGKGDTDEARSQALEVLRRHPLDAGLLRSLAIAEERAGRLDRAAALMSKAGALSWRDAGANAWLFEQHLSKQRRAAAARRADALLRTTPEMGERLFPVLARAALDPAMAAEIGKRLANQPSWRGPFIGALSAQDDQHATFLILQALQATSAPPTEAEVQPYVERLVNAGRPEEALLSVILFLPPNRLDLMGNLYNGEFVQASGIKPFDWVLAPAAGVTTLIESPPQRPSDPALHVLYDGMSSKALVIQALALPQGKYRFEGEVSSSTPQTSRNVIWTLSCMGGKTLTSTPVAANTNWNRFSHSFVVGSGCPGQWLQLMPTSSGRTTPFEAWYDKLTIVLDNAE